MKPLIQRMSLVGFYFAFGLSLWSGRVHAQTAEPNLQTTAENNQTPQDQKIQELQNKLDEIQKELMELKRANSASPETHYITVTKDPASPSAVITPATPQLLQPLLHRQLFQCRSL